MTDEGKLTHGLARTLAGKADAEPISVIVRYGALRRVMRHREPLAGVQQSYHYRLRPFVHFYATPEGIRRLAEDEQVVCIYEDLPVHAFLDVSVPRIQVPALWDAGLTGEGVRIAIVDTGIDPTHPDFRGRVAETTDFTGEGPIDRHGHGTHCASVAAGSGAASGGKYRGVAPQAAIYAAKVLRADGEGMMSDVMAGIEWAVDRGVQVIGLSLGGSGPSDGTDALSEMCDAATEAGVTLCVAAGNDGPAAYTIGPPGAARQVITVGATDDSDRVGYFSSRGPTLDGRVKPDIVLPGVDIVAARAVGTNMGTMVNDYYTGATGTSMAAPHAAGVCALLLQAEPGLTPQQIKARLMDSAIDLGADPYAQGSGRADAWRAWQNQVQPYPKPEPTPPSPPSPSPGQGCLTSLLQLLFRGRGRS
ncbi:MAG: S8 family peptidase [Chloroflexi bacterium]|nr:S8 family peptidase [Chloroflexota bacterium]